MVTENDSSKNKVILIVGVFFGVIALLVIFMIFCCLCWRRKMNDAMNNNRKYRLSGLDRGHSTGTTLSSRDVSFLEGITTPRANGSPMVRRNDMK